MRVLDQSAPESATYADRRAIDAPRVVVLSASAYTLGGMERVMQMLGQYLPDRGVQSQVLIPDRHLASDLESWFRYHDVAVTRSWELAKLPERGLRGVPALMRLLRKQHATIASIHSPGAHLPLLEMVAARLAGLRIVVSIHGFDPSPSASHAVRTRLISTPLFDTMVVPTNLLRRQQVRFGTNPRRLRLIHYGVDTSPSYARDASRSALGIAANALVITCLGRLVPDKGIDVLVRAINSLPDDLLNGLHVFIGGVGDRDAYEALVTERARPAIKFVGHINNTGMYYASSDIFVLASRHEPFGIVFQEAAVYGIPSIATRVGGIPEAIVDEVTGVLVEPDDPAALAHAIERLLRDAELRARLGQAARARAEDEFSVGSMIGGYAGIFDSL